MNHEYYREVLEDVQKDLAEVEQSVSELHGIERYVQRKMEADSGDGNSKLSYDQCQALLDDVRQDVDGARSRIGELRGVGNFAREKLRQAGIQVGELKAAKPVENASAGDGKSAKGEPGESDAMPTVEFGPDGFPK